ncbi:MAG: mismatch repair protein MutL [Thermotogaceae bacterium]|jgi:DNA mismatch repair protein MutL|nr:mismatch repair protein MutL [Thermotogaceae bacterium]MDN5337455.1 mismatch repair protein MutL [Thermotogaceae bacterium]
MRIIELPEDVVKRIAAGEVVTRPVSVVKELVENSVDAGAETILLRIENGGKSLIEVVDDGSGMEKEEIILAIKPHTTSKIRDIKDLYSLSTYGFRGEALASIVNVSETTIISKTSSQTLGTELIVKGGEIQKIGEIACNTGTTVRVKNLFFNIPARRKFLSSANIEGRMITELFQKFLLSLLPIHLIFVRDGEQIYNAVPASDLLERILMVFPELEANQLVKVEAQENGVKIYGYLSRPGIGLKNRTGQIFFVNGRYVRVSQLYKTLETAVGAKTSLYPYSVIFLEVPPENIDVNVHPQKLEVKFSKYQRLHELLVKTVRNAFESNITHRIVSSRPSSNKIVEGSRTRIHESSKKGFLFEDSKDAISYQKNIFRDLSKVSETFPDNFEKKEQVEEIEYPKKFKVIGVFGERYIICQYEDKLVFIDQHAAHERIIYEELKSKSDEFLKPQTLAFPVELKLDRLRLDILREKLDFLNKLGFEIDLQEEKAIIRTLPVILDISKLEETLREIISELRIAEFVDENKILDSVYAKLACSAAVKTSDKLQLDDIDELIKNVLSRKLLTCPHGRPLMIEISEKDLDKWFGRG